jgi:heme/copper-type cytochrome/quinol oxidase subunit 2
MEILLLISYFIFFLIAFILTFTSFKYFITMWKFKNRKKDGSEDDNLKGLIKSKLECTNRYIHLNMYIRFS